MDEPAKPKRKHLNAAERRARMAADAAMFIRQYARKAQKNKEPNDRQYSREVAESIKHMNPIDFDRLLRDDEP
jgi:hypothetical protein